MKKKFIIKDARRLLAEQINSSQIVEGKNMNIETMSKMKGLSEVIPKDNDGYCTVYKMDCADGLGLMTVYQAFPGIQLIYNDFEATEYEWEGIFDKNILEINHCREGREGSRFQQYPENESAKKSVSASIYTPNLFNRWRYDKVPNI